MDRLEPALPFYRVQPLAHRLWGHIAEQRFLARLLSALAALLAGAAVRVDPVRAPKTN